MLMNLMSLAHQSHVDGLADVPGDNAPGFLEVDNGAPVNSVGAFGIHQDRLAELLSDDPVNRTVDFDDLAVVVCLVHGVKVTD